MIVGFCFIAVEPFLKAHVLAEVGVDPVVCEPGFPENFCMRFIDGDKELAGQVCIWADDWKNDAVLDSNNWFKPYKDPWVDIHWYENVPPPGKPKEWGSIFCEWLRTEHYMALTWKGDPAENPWDIDSPWRLMAALFTIEAKGKRTVYYAFDLQDFLGGTRFGLRILQPPTWNKHTKMKIGVIAIYIHKNCIRSAEFNSIQKSIENIDSEEAFMELGCHRCCRIGVICGQWFVERYRGPSILK